MLAQGRRPQRRGRVFSFISLIIGGMKLESDGWILEPGRESIDPFPINRSRSMDGDRWIDSSGMDDR